MPARPLVTAFLMDPIESVDIDADTTFVLMLEAQRRGHEVLTGSPRDLFVEDGAAVARLRPVSLRRERGHHAELGPERIVALDREVQLLFQRKDPPVDLEYVTALQIL
ncbi:MAG: glutathione synthase, partial [Deltaproteobacteria bacterium]